MSKNCSICKDSFYQFSRAPKCECNGHLFHHICLDTLPRLKNENNSFKAEINCLKDVYNFLSKRYSLLEERYASRANQVQQKITGTNEATKEIVADANSIKALKQKDERIQVLEKKLKNLKGTSFFLVFWFLDFFNCKNIQHNVILLKIV